MLAPTIMVQGTASSVGKSLLVTGLCRYFSNMGIKVAPFKAQNMALNSYVTASGAEIGRAQVAQAEAARTLPTAEMNPVLLKPEGDKSSQVVVMGKAIKGMSAKEYHNIKPQLRNTIKESLLQLRQEYELVIIEGAGSPAEVNLKQNDIVNMHVAKIFDSPVILVGDIDRGGVFASFVGTMELLTEEERELIFGFVVNKFRGDKSLLEPGLDFLTDRTDKPVLGVLPYQRNLRLAEEDSIALDDRPRKILHSDETVSVAVIRLPRISNYDEFDSLEHEEDIHLSYVTNKKDVERADLVIIPGSKNTISDLNWLKSNGLAESIKKRVLAGKKIIGICGGFQMLGEVVEDPHLVEGEAKEAKGLGLLPVKTIMQKTKITSQVKASWIPGHGYEGQEMDVSGYEIHHGIATLTDDVNYRPTFILRERNQGKIEEIDGAQCSVGLVFASHIHGLFDNEVFRKWVLTPYRIQKNLETLPRNPPPSRDETYERLATAVAENLDCAAIAQKLNLDTPYPYPTLGEEPCIGNTAYSPS